jgi:hypothetical protein
MILGRVISSIIAFFVSSAINFAISAPATLMSGAAAGRQFDNSDESYVVTLFFSRAFTGVNAVITSIFLLVLVGIWWKPVRKLIAALTAAAFVLFAPVWSARAYYDKQDFAEVYFILPNESAFFIPDAGANKDSQTAFGSEEYLKANKIAAKRFQIPHAKLAGSSYGFWSDYYVPTGRLIIVDRSPFNREWVASAHRGTSPKDESFPCQSKEGINISVGIAIGTSVLEENVAKFLYRFGVKSPQGDRSKPEVIFTSVFYGRSLPEIMDGPVRSKVQSLVCDEFTKRSFDEGNAQPTAIMSAIEAKTIAYLLPVGITLDYIGWADTFTFDKNVQDVINRRYIASQEAEIAMQMAPHTGTLQALAAAEATRTAATKWDGKVPSTVSLWWLPAGLTDWLTGVFNKKGAGATGQPGHE